MTLMTGVYTGPNLGSVDVERAEEILGVRLPRDYVNDLLDCNGGVPSSGRFFLTQFSTSWSPTGFEITEVLGIGGEMGIDDPVCGALPVGREWGYPEGCIAFCLTPAAGPDTVAFDYRDCGPNGDPCIVYIDVDSADPEPRRIADDYTKFLAGLVMA